MLSRNTHSANPMYLNHVSSSLTSARGFRTEWGCEHCAVLIPVLVTFIFLESADSARSAISGGGRKRVHSTTTAPRGRRSCWPAYPGDSGEPYLATAILILRHWTLCKRRARFAGTIVVRRCGGTYYLSLSLSIRRSLREMPALRGALRSGKPVRKIRLLFFFLFQKGRVKVDAAWVVPKNFGDPWVCFSFLSNATF